MMRNVTIPLVSSKQRVPMTESVTNPTGIPIYLVSLPSDTERRENLRERLPESYDEFVHVEAINGRDLPARDYYEKTVGFASKHGRPMTPAELGCTLSHLKALETFMDSSADRALILEDDILGTDTDIETIRALSHRLDDDDLLICGGQDGLESRKYQYGEPTAIPGVYEVCRFSYRYVFRTCCYVVTRRSAQAIINYQNFMLSLADKWDEFFSDTRVKIHYANILSHPVELEESHIEQDRAVFQTTELHQQVLTRDVFENIYLSLRRTFNVARCKLRRCVQLHP
jgi:glycosyl transferase family 25